MMRIYSLLLISAGLLVVAVADTGVAPHGLAPKRFLNLPLGHVKPGGYLENVLIPSTNMGTKLGKAEGFYDYLSRADTEWIARPTDVYTLEGAGSHWFNDIITIAGISENEILQSQAEQFLDYFLDTQDADGWLGPEVTTGRPRRLSGRLPFLLGAMRVADAQPARTDRIVTGLHRFVALVHDMLRRGEGLEDDAWAYAGDLLIVLQWLYEFHPNRNEDTLVETMRILSRTGDHWTSVFEEEKFPTVDPQQQWQLPDAGTHWRGMNAAKTLTTLGARYRLSNDGSDDATWDSIFKTDAERLGPFEPTKHAAHRAHRNMAHTHFTTETIRSAHYLYQITGDIKYLESIDRLAHAAMPAPIHGGWGTVSSLALCREAFTPDGPYHEYGGYLNNPTCRAVRYPEGGFDLVYEAFLYTADRKSLVQALLGPLTVNTTLAEDNEAVITMNSSYPFGWDTLTKAVIVAQKAFVYYVRIPSWSAGATISINGSSFDPCKPVNGLHAIRIEPGTTNVTLDLPLELVADQPRPGHVTIRRGPVIYAFAAWYPFSEQDAHRGVHYAIDPSTLSPSITPLSYNNYLWREAGHTITVVACPIATSKVDNEIFAPGDGSVTCIGPVRNLTLVPSTDWYIRRHAVKEFPTFHLSDLL
ncbi:uncharacterized protein TRAVEDRAFT_73885 [Trametes versicolor FP-101664 SS1]|uniref:uncharacterized protein n=1 Tax=Trametes versicolor (strain FP-101664) TaxID=717944 RepID=UPI00046237DE|nr:uncharacterized protein TRAVEDRAFT_73885 [Trametes versicolor FP-101664 SS1]EIW54769.1 hypothetical protein TRAVEDRAFT_73885 [Trametes versicolor FP-101664 SS1]